MSPPSDANIEKSVCLCNTVQRLIPLYSAEATDRADSVLSGHPDTTQIARGLQLFIDILLPARMTSGTIEADEMDIFMIRRLSQAWRILRPEVERALPFLWIGEAARIEGAPEPFDVHQRSIEILHKLFQQMPDIRALVIEDIQAAYDGDPSALTFAEVQLAYPGLLAIASYRLSHELYTLGVPIVPRIMSEWTHSRTGVDIHPGAEIGRAFFIDHATGVVIGETSHIGDRVKLYQGVTLGAKSFPLDAAGHPIKHIRRHPTVCDDVVIYANSTILGDVTIGANSTIGGNVFLTESVPEESFVGAKHPELHIRTSDERKS